MAGNSKTGTKMLPGMQSPIFPTTSTCYTKCKTKQEQPMYNLFHDQYTEAAIN